MIYNLFKYDDNLANRFDVIIDSINNSTGRVGFSEQTFRSLSVGANHGPSCFPRHRILDVVDVDTKVGLRKQEFTARAYGGGVDRIRSINGREMFEDYWRESLVNDLNTFTLDWRLRRIFRWFRYKLTAGWNTLMESTAALPVCL